MVFTNICAQASIYRITTSDLEFIETCSRLQRRDARLVGHLRKSDPPERDLQRDAQVPGHGRRQVRLVLQKEEQRQKSESERRQQNRKLETS